MRYKRYSINYSRDYTAKIYRCPKDYDELDFTLHWHKEYEFVYVEKGPLKISKLNEEVILNNGDIFFMNTEEIHSYIDTNKNNTFMIVNFPTTTLTPFVDNPSDFQTFNIEKNLNSKKILTDSLRQLSEMDDYDTKVGTLKIKSLLSNIYYELIKNCTEPYSGYFKGSDSQDFDCAKSAILYMLNNFKKDIPLSEIANYVGMTPAHFSKYFKDKTETTFSKYLRKIRLEHAISDMVKKDMSVQDAAKENGFPNVNSFIMSCKSEYGRTPLEMKNLSQT